jgi:predicted DNA-binding transcriptional regulator YafY
MSNVSRILYIHQRAQSEQGVKRSEIVQEFEISDRQAGRDIEYLRFSCNAPLEYDNKTKSYRYAEPFSGFDFMGEDALLARVLIHTLARSQPFMPMNADELKKRLDDFVPKSLVGLEGKIRYELPATEPVNHPLMTAIMQVMNSQQTMTIDYEDVNKQATTRKIEPRRLVNYGGAWYCIAVDCDKRAVRNFRLSRICSFIPNNGPPPVRISDNEIDAYIDGCYGAFKGPVHDHAVCRFYGTARNIVEHEIWHPDQDMECGNDALGDYIQLKLPFTRHDEILARILQYGAQAKAIAPDSLVKAWHEEIVRMHELVSSGVK